MYLIGGLLMIALGLFMLLRPDDFFDLAGAGNPKLPVSPPQLLLLYPVRRYHVPHRGYDRHRNAVSHIITYRPLSAIFPYFKEVF